ncbi:hypothetical protein [Cyclobacterium qasimii]|uniref:Uncharacterized protein n=2 Tax=Cyclobacterium qasimii TaxID=1350429 RepID=S7WEM3_9BACT|nr:hypothetical protein [Cyclobacterium qasimii]EPR65209.1 hypothetical protein ADICYQ_5742 [Cyclobacterium qasimii M12-11B]
MKFRDLRIWIFIFGIMLLIGAYLYQHSKTNQSQLESQGIKAIFLAKHNFLDSFYNYHVQLEGYFKRNFYTWGMEAEEDAASRMVNMIDRNPKFGIERIQNFTDDLRPEPQMFAEDGISLIQRDTSYLIYVKGFRFFLNDKTKMGDQPVLNYDSLRIKIKKELGNALAQDTLSGRAFEIDHSVSVNDLMVGNVQSLFFDKLFILDQTGTAIYPRDLAGLPVVNVDSLSHEQTVGERELDLQVSGKLYKGFLSPAVIGNQVFYLLGAKDKSGFESVALKINFKVLSAFLTLLILIFVSIPVISIFNLGDGDVLTKKRVMGLGLSLILVMVILGFFFFSLFQNYDNEHTSENNLQNVKYAFNSEIQQLIEGLEIFKEEIEDGQIHTNQPEDAHHEEQDVNEFLEFDLEGNILKMLIPQMSSFEGPIDFGNFPFVSIANRDYVKELRNLDPEQGYFISAHSSKSTGELEGVISKKEGEQGYALTFHLDSLVPKISKHHRFFVFKPDGKVLLISEKVNIPIDNLNQGIGEEKWHEIRTLIANNKNAGDDKVWKTPIYVNGHEYQALLSPISSDSFVSENWVLYLEDTNLQHALHSLASLEGIAVFGPYLMILSLLGLLTLVTRKSSIYLAFEDFSFAWYSPSPRKRLRFLWLNSILLLDIFLFLIIYLFLPLSIFKIFLWSSLFAIQSGTCNFLLLATVGKDKAKKNINAFLVMVILLWVIMAFLLGYLSFLSHSGTMYFIFTLFILLMIAGMQILCFYLYQTQKFPTVRFSKWNKTKMLFKMHRRFTDFWTKLTGSAVDKRVFAINLLLWLMIVGFLPGYFIHRQIFNQEKIIWEYVSKGDIEDEEQVKFLPEGYMSLIKIHEEFRRNNFGRFSNQDDELITNFIAAPQQALIEAFNTTPGITFGKLSKGIGLWDTIRSNLFFLLVLLVILIWLFKMIMVLGNKIYLIDYHFTNAFGLLPKDTDKQKNSFVIGVDASKSKEWILKQFGFESEEVLTVRLFSGNELDMPELKPAHKGVILENFHCLGDVEMLLNTMVAFQKKYCKESVKLFVTSGRPLQEILPSNMPKQSRLLITEIFSEYLFQYVPIDFENQKITLPYFGDGSKFSDEEAKINYDLRMKSQLFNDEKTHGLAGEIEYGPNGKAIASLITEEISRDKLDMPLSQERYEKCVLSIQRYNKAYYMNIWAELSLKEKKMVYNYAKEGFINFFNKETMTALIQKGLVKMNPAMDSLVLFSDSFRNFVCVYISDEEVARFKQDESKSGNARMIQAAVFSFVLICIALISFYDPNILNETSAYITGFLGVSGTIYSILAKGFGKSTPTENQ